MPHAHRVLAIAAALLIVAIANVQAAANPKLIDFLKTRPTDRAKLGLVLKKFLDAKDYENAYLVGRYVAKHLGDRSVKMYETLAVCAFAQKDPERARGFANEALRLDPTTQIARRIMAKLEPSKGTGGQIANAPQTGTAGFIATSPAPDAAPAPAAPTAGRAAPVVADAAADARPEAKTAAPVTSPAAASLTAPAPLSDDAPLLASLKGGIPMGKLEEARRSFYGDRFDKALNDVNGVLASSPKDVDSLILKARIQAARMEYKESATILRDLATRERSNDPDVFLALASLARELAGVTNQERELKTAHDHYRSALKAGPEHVGTLLAYSSFLYQLNQPDLANPMYQKALKHLPFRGRETLLDHAQILFFRNKPKDALEVLSQYTRTYGSDSNSLRLEGMVQLRLDKREEAGESFELAFMRNPSNLPMILTIVPVLVTMDQAERALKVISAAEARHPDNKQVSELKAQIKMRVLTDRELQRKTRGPFVYTYPKALEGRPDKALESIFAAFDGAFRHVNRVLDYTPNKINVRISTVTGIDNPAYYSPDTDTITIGAQWFFQERGELAREIAERREHSAHMVRHEYAHLVFAHRLSVEDFRAVNATIPLWLLEGVAEWCAGGVSTLTGSPNTVKTLFRDGFLDYAAMERHMQVINGSKDPGLNHKSYLQSYFIVKYLIGRGGSDKRAGVDSFMAFNQELVQGTGKFDVALQKVYKLSLEGFRKGWTGQIEQDVISRVQPDLLSFDVPAMGTEPETAMVDSAAVPVTR